MSELIYDGNQLADWRSQNPDGVVIDLTSITPDGGGGIEEVAVGIISGLQGLNTDLASLVPAGLGRTWQKRLEGAGCVFEVRVPMSASSGWQDSLRRILPKSATQSSLVGMVRRRRSSGVTNIVGDSVTWYPFHRAVAGSHRSVVTVHDLRVFQTDLASSMDQRIISQNIAAAQALVCSWNHPYKDLLARFPQAAHKTFLVPLPVLNSGSAFVDRRVEVNSHRRLRLLYPAFVTPHKNHEVIIRALALDDQLELTCTGKEVDSHSQKLKELARTLGVSDRIAWKGYVSPAALDYEFDNADLLVMPSRWEAASGPIFEAITRGLPFVASRIPPLTSQINAVQVTVPTFEWDKPQELVEAIRSAVIDYQRIRVEMKGAAYRLTTRKWIDAARDYRGVFDWASGSAAKPTHLQPNEAS